MKLHFNWQEKNKFGHVSFLSTLLRDAHYDAFCMCICAHMMSVWSSRAVKVGQRNSLSLDTLKDLSNLLPFRFVVV